MTTQTVATQKHSPTDSDLIKSFDADCQLKRMTSVTVKKYSSMLRMLSSKLKEKGHSLSHLDKEALKAILELLAFERGLSQKTLENYFSALSTFCDYLVWEGLAEMNFVRPFRERYLSEYKKNDKGSDRKLISVDDMGRLINSILDPRDKAIVTLLAKTGIRRNELINIDLDDIDWVEQSILLKSHPKRSNCLVFFDDECAIILSRWIKIRQNYNLDKGCHALFVNEQGNRLKRHGTYAAIIKHATRIGLHDSNSKKIEDRFTPHCCRHWFTTHLRRNGIRREYLKELRGDARNESIDIYDHIDKKELKIAYLAAVPVLGIT